MNSFRHFNGAPEVIRLTAMLQIRYPLSLCQAVDPLLERGTDMCHEAVRLRWSRFGPMFATEIRKRVQSNSHSRRSRHLDEVFARIYDETNFLWRAVDHEDEVLEVLAAKRRDRKAAPKSLKRAIRRFGRPTAIATDRLRSYRAAVKEIGSADDHECGRWLNNRIENSHQPFQRRERAMAEFTDMKTLQKFASVDASVHNRFNPDRQLARDDDFKQNRFSAPAEWRQIAAWTRISSVNRRQVRIGPTPPGRQIAYAQTASLTFSALDDRLCRLSPGPAVREASCR